MWSYSKKLEYPVRIARPNAAAAKVIISQLGGPNCNTIAKKQKGCYARFLTVIVYFDLILFAVKGDGLDDCAQNSVFL